MTCVSTAQQATEPVDTKQPLSSLIGTFGIHPTVGILTNDTSLVESDDCEHNLRTWETHYATMSHSKIYLAALHFPTCWA